MSTISIGVPTKNLTSEQCFAPKCDKSLRVKILGVKRPQSHVAACGLTPQLRGARADARKQQRQSHTDHASTRPLELLVGQFVDAESEYKCLSLLVVALRHLA